MIDYESSFWSVPPDLRESAIVGFWGADMPHPHEYDVDDSLDGAAWMVSDLIGDGPQVEYAFRTVWLFADTKRTQRLGINPLVIDIDLLDSAQTQLEEQRTRVTDHLRGEGWRLRVFVSGAGYHVELDPQSVLGRPVAQSHEVSQLVRRLVRDFDGSGHAERAHIDLSDRHTWLRMVGSRNTKGGLKKLA